MIQHSRWMPSMNSLIMPDLLDLDPEVTTAMLAMYRAYDPDLPADQRAQYCQMQLSMETDGGRASVSHAAKRVFIHPGDRFVGHRLTNCRFTDVAFDDNIRLESNQNLPLVLSRRRGRPDNLLLALQQGDQSN